MRTENFWRSTFREVSFVSTRDDWEYIYDKEEQVRLKGSSFSICVPST
jgi:hypothetical protein